MPPTTSTTITMCGVPCSGSLRWWCQGCGWFCARLWTQSEVGYWCPVEERKEDNALVGEIKLVSLHLTSLSGKTNRQMQRVTQWTLITIFLSEWRAASQNKMQGLNMKRQNSDSLFCFGGKKDLFDVIVKTQTAPTSSWNAKIKNPHNLLENEIIDLDFKSCGVF